jgi:PleD family two-component response regulator
MSRASIDKPPSSDSPTRKERGAILVIDDSEIDLAAMSDLLAAAGFEVHGLPSPIGATRVARQLRIQLVVIDQHLPAMDGSKLASLFRANTGLRNVRVILISGDDASALELAETAHVDAFVSKRNMHVELAATVKRLLAQ